MRPTEVIVWYQIASMSRLLIYFTSYVQLKLYFADAIMFLIPIPTPIQLTSFFTLKEIFWNLPPTNLSTNTNRELPVWSWRAILLLLSKFMDALHKERSTLCGMEKTSTKTIIWRDSIFCRFPWLTIGSFAAKNHNFLRFFDQKSHLADYW